MGNGFSLDILLVWLSLDQQLTLNPNLTWSSAWSTVFPHVRQFVCLICICITTLCEWWYLFSALQKSTSGPAWWTGRRPSSGRRWKTWWERWAAASTPRRQSAPHQPIQQNINQQSATRPAKKGRAITTPFLLQSINCKRGEDGRWWGCGDISNFKH